MAKPSQINQFLEDLKNNPSMIRWDVSKVVETYNLTPEEAKRFEHAKNACKGLEGKQLEERVNTLSRWL